VLPLRRTKATTLASFSGQALDCVLHHPVHS
jgi:hypothetical protein